VAKRLVLCCDGTWNTRQVPAPTNVVKLSDGLVQDYDADGRPLHEPVGMPQMVKYQAGVGTLRMERVRGGVFGFGLSRNVRELYGYIVDRYEPGDELYFFGFSRGAYTARSAVGLIYNCGILRREHKDRLDEAYRRYKSSNWRKRPGSEESKRFRRDHSHDDVAIRFVGVWDTVGALGIPIPGLPRFIKQYWGFHDATLNKDVRGAYQALAIDERRGAFEPALWKQEQGAPPTQEVQQLWFAGCHRDVGGGQEVPDLSEIPLLWMLDRARVCDLAFKPDHFQLCDRGAPVDDQARNQGKLLRPNPMAEFEDSRKGVYRFLASKQRMLGAQDKDGQPLAQGESVASSAQRRVAETAYGPQSLLAWLNAKKAVTAVEDGG
jgi:uncharacterized protein (DUF2235 family)